MCGRYHFGISDSKKGQKIKERARKIKLVYKTGEIFPSDRVLCVIPVGSDLDLAVKKWGIQRKSLQINARIESIDEKYTYKDMRNRHCAVICDGLYEWDRDKNKYFISFREEYMYLACIFNDEDELLIITREAGKEFEGIHDRQPMILDEEEMKKYIHHEDFVVKEKELVIRKEEYEMKLF